MYAARLLGCEGDGNAGVGSGRGVVAVSVYMGGTRGSGVLISAGDVLEMRGVGGVCDMCMCLARGGMGCVGVTGLGFTNYMGKVGYVSVFWLRWCGWCWGRMGALARVLGGWDGVMSV